MSDDTRSFSTDLVSLGQLIRPLWRQRAVLLSTFAGLFLLTVVGAVLTKPEYEGSMKILVKRERADPIITSSTSEPAPDSGEPSESELNSEVELIKSRDLLQGVVVTAGLVSGPTPATATDATATRAAAAAQTTTRSSPAAENRELSRAIAKLAAALEVGLIRKSTLIEVRYTSTDPDLAANVLSTLSRLYIEKHLALHRPEGVYQFFQGQTQTLHGELAAAEGRLAEFGKTERVVSPIAERDSALQLLAEFEGALVRTQAQIAESERRMSTLRQQIAATPNRQTTEIRSGVDAERIRDLKAKVFDLERRQADMVRFYSSEYPPLQQLTEQVTLARASLLEAEQTPITEEKTDQNPTHQWLRDEVARTATEREALSARARSLAADAAAYRAKARRLEDARVKQDELVREVRTAEQNYELYQRKQEEARIADALDRTGVANVALAEGPVVPAQPSQAPRIVILLLGTILSAMASVLVAFAWHRRNPYFSSDDDLAQQLRVPVLAVLPSGARRAS